MVTIDGGDTFKCLHKNRNDLDYLAWGNWKEMGKDLPCLFFLIFFALKSKKSDSESIAKQSIFKEFVVSIKPEEVS